MRILLVLWTTGLVAWSASDAALAEGTRAPDFHSSGAFVPQAASLTRLKSLTGKAVADPALSATGLTLHVLDRAAAKAQCPFVLFHGDAVYLRVDLTQTLMEDDAIVDADGKDVMAPDVPPRIAPLDDGGELRAYPLSKPVDDGMTLRFNVLNGVEVRSATLVHVPVLIGHQAVDPLLREAGVTVTVEDPSPPGTPPNQIITRRSMLILRLTGPADVIRRMKPPNVEVADGLPWGINTSAERESETEVRFFYMLAAPMDNAIQVKVPLLFKAVPTNRATTPEATSHASTPHQFAAAGPSDPEVLRLIERLGDGDLAARDSAYQQLAEMGPRIVPALREAAGRTGSPEMRARLRDLIRAVDRPPLRRGSKVARITES